MRDRHTQALNHWMHQQGKQGRWQQEGTRPLLEITNDHSDIGIHQTVALHNHIHLP